MGKGSLQRIAASTLAATASILVAGVGNVAALPGLPSTDTTLPAAPQVTVPSTTTTVPSTPVTPETKVTTPTVTTPKVSPPKATTPKVTTPTVTAPDVTAPQVKTPKVSTPKVSTPKVSTPKVSTPGVTIQGGSGTSTGSGGGGSAVTDRVSSTTGTVGGLLTGTSGTGTATTGIAGASTGTGSGAGSALAAMGFFGGPAGPAGGAGAGGGGGGIFGATAFRGSGPNGRGGLPARLSAAEAEQLRHALELLSGCMPAIAPLDRQVLLMRAGGPTSTPMSRSQVAGRLGIPVGRVRTVERRGLVGLRTAAEQTGCAGAIPAGPFAVSGIGAMTLATLLGTPTAGTPVLAQGGNDYVPAREAQAGRPSPLARLAGGGESGPAWLVVLVTVLFSVAIAGLMRELRGSVAPRI